MRLLSRLPKLNTTLRAVPLPEESRFGIHGESHYQPALRRTAEFATQRRFRAILVAEPDNKHDPNAIAVYSQAGKLGYVPRKKAPACGPVFDEIARQGYEAGVCTGVLYGGYREKPFFGVLLSLSHPDDCLTQLEEN